MKWASSHNQHVSRLLVHAMTLFEHIEDTHPDDDYTITINEWQELFKTHKENMFLFSSWYPLLFLLDCMMQKNKKIVSVSRDNDLNIIALNL